MFEPLVSVIIPAYNGSRHIGQTIESVLGQTYGHFELIVVDDASTDETAAVVARFDDRRVQYVAHESNRGADAARVTALRASAGQLIAFLDQDDLFHPEKLEAHVAFMRENPDTGVTYNPHFTLSYPSGHILGVSRPPDPMSLEELIVGFPIPPSACVIRREWATREELWDERTFFRGREIVFFGRLFVSGCDFSLVNRTLNYRRVEAGRRFSDPLSKCRHELRCQALMLDDPRCPPHAAAYRAVAFTNSYLFWANVAFAQHETESGRLLLEEAIRLDPTLLNGNLGRLVDLFLTHAVDNAQDPEAQLRDVFAQLPPELSTVAGHLEWAVEQASLIKGAQHVIWGQPADAVPHFARAAVLGATVSKSLVQRLAYELINHEQEFGPDATHDVMEHLHRNLSTVVGTQSARRFNASFWLSRAFRLFEDGDCRGVPRDVVRAFRQDPTMLANRGAWSILGRAVSTSLLRARGNRYS